MESLIIKKQIAQQKAIERLQLRQADTINYTTFNQPASLTLTRTNTLAITTAGTTITWESENRNNGFTWSGTDITIPISGHYLFNFTYVADLAHTVYGRLFVNGISVSILVDSTITSTVHSLIIMRYFSESDVVRIQLVPSVNVTISVIAEGASPESPILNIVQLTGVLP
jgi:hypothetical protein